MRLKPSDLNAFMPPMRQAQIIAEVNDALEKADRIDSQIKIWSLKNESDLYTKIVQDELEFLKKGKV